MNTNAIKTKPFCLFKQGLTQGIYFFRIQSLQGTYIQTGGFSIKSKYYVKLCDSSIIT